MTSLIPLAAFVATLGVVSAAPAWVDARISSQEASSSSVSSSESADSSSAASSSADCPAKSAKAPQPPKPDPTARTTSSCFNPYVKQPGTSATSSSSSSSAPH